MQPFLDFILFYFPKTKKYSYIYMPYRKSKGSQLVWTTCGRMHTKAFFDRLCAKKCTQTEKKDIYGQQ